MLFNSFAFLFLYLPITLLGYYLIKKKNLQLWFLFFSSVFFYAYWSTTYVFLLLFTVALDFFLANRIFESKNQKTKKHLLLASVFINLGVLGFFKYYNFFADSADGLIHFLGGNSNIPNFDLILPIGISFYTFQSMSYVIDVYRGTSHAHGRLLEFAGYVTLFPHQISGPLVRHNAIVPQLESDKTYFFNSENFWKGIVFFIIGLSKKMLVADRIAAVVDPIVMNMSQASNAEALLAMLGYTTQLYFDFSGYSDMAVGLGLMMNIQFPQNFNSPYKSRSITEFWQRWHITLSSWLKDYLYISMGGNRGSSFETYRNLMLTMVIGGFWHGANWTYVVWGSFHGGILAIERLFKDKKWNLISNNYVSWVLTFIIVNIGWIFFRAHDLQQAWAWLNKVLFMNAEITWETTLIAIKHRDQFFASLIVGLGISLFAKNSWQLNMKPTFKNALLLALLFVICLSFMGEESPFLYFQF